MLVLKKKSIKKLAVYISIIVAMFGGTGFMLYQNKKLTDRKSVIIDNPARYDEIMKAGVVAAEIKIAPTPPSAAPPKAAVKIKNNQGFDLTVFSSEKFKELKENILIVQEKLGLGKRDIFKPN
jgi:hypothetical protein